MNVLTQACKLRKHYLCGSSRSLTLGLAHAASHFCHNAETTAPTASCPSSRDRQDDCVPTHDGSILSRTSKFNRQFNGVIVGHVIGIREHPKADRLRLCDVDVGDGPECIIQIVCGAPNVRAGLRVPVAVPGSTLSVPLEGDERKIVKIKKTRIRGEVSNGMICSSKELGLAGDSSGVMELDSSASVGSEFVDYRSSIVETSD